MLRAQGIKHGAQNAMIQDRKRVVSPSLYADQLRGSDLVFPAQRLQVQGHLQSLSLQAEGAACVQDLGVSKSVQGLERSAHCSPEAVP